MNVKERHETLYKQIPSFKCKNGCTNCCGIILFSKWERDRLSDKRKAKSIDCPYAKSGCEIYEQCPHGCRPVVLLSEQQEQANMKEYFELTEVGT